MKHHPSEKSLLEKLSKVKTKSEAGHLLWDLYDLYPCETYEEYALSIQEDEEDGTRTILLKTIKSMAKRELSPPKKKKQR